MENQLNISVELCVALHPKIRKVFVLRAKLNDQVMVKPAEKEKKIRDMMIFNFWQEFKLFFEIRKRLRISICFHLLVAISNAWSPMEPS